MCLAYDLEFTKNGILEWNVEEDRTDDDTALEPATDTFETYHVMKSKNYMAIYVNVSMFRAKMPPQSGKIISKADCPM